MTNEPKMPEFTSVITYPPGRVQALVEALEKVIWIFETDHMIEGVVVDDPPSSIVYAYHAAKDGLKEWER